MLNGLSCEDVLGIVRKVALPALADGIADSPLTMDGIDLGPEARVRGN